MACWLRFAHGEEIKFGALEDGVVAVHEGDMFAAPRPAGERVDLGAVRILTPCSPSKMICLWNNFHELAAKNKFQEPEEPLYFIKAANAYHPHGEPIRRPKSYPGKIVYEGELGIVIGRRCADVGEAEAPDHIFGYTCVNDVTAIDLLKKDSSFDQWVRAKSFDTFGVFGPVIATDVDPMALRIRTVLNGTERQNYPVADMFFPPARLVSLISRDITLLPGDLIACGTSVGVGVMREPENLVEVVIDGVGTLSNRFDQAVAATA